MVPLLERALAALGEGDSALRVGVLARLATAARDEPLRERRAALGEEALRIARRSGDPATLAAAIEGHYIALEGPRSTSAARGSRSAPLISLGEQIGDKEKVFAGNDHGLHCVWALADRAAVDVRVQALGELADELRQPPHHWDVGTTRSMVALMEGRFEDAERLIADTLGGRPAGRELERRGLPPARPVHPAPRAGTLDESKS